MRPTETNALDRRTTPRIACVVRTVGERTTDLCAELLEKDLGQAPERISIPVHRDMVQRCFEYALEQEADVLITVDADVLPYKGGASELLRLYRTVPSNTFVIVPRIDDHLLGKERVGGLRLYRVSLLRKALELLPTSSNVRPESSLMTPMAAAGFPSVMAESVCGLHDAEQYLGTSIGRPASTAIETSNWCPGCWSDGERLRPTTSGRNLRPRFSA